MKAIIPLFLACFWLASPFAQAQPKPTTGGAENYNVSDDITTLNRLFNSHIRETVKDRCHIILSGDLSNLLQQVFADFHNTCKKQHIRDRECFYSKEQYCNEITHAFKETQGEMRVHEFQR